MNIIIGTKIRKLNTMLSFLSFIIFSYNSALAQTPDIEKLDDAVVLVLIYDYEGNKIGHGSGFLIDDKGTVVTNYHVVESAYSLKVMTDINGLKMTYDVDLISKGSKSKDLAIINIKNNESKIFPYLPLAKNYPSKGVDCWAIGTPASEKYMNTVSKGLVSNINTSSNPVMIQTNAEITHGSSGGALINSRGEVIGITSAGDPTEDGARASINFAIWSGEIATLESINKNTVVNPESIPCEFGFYTDNKYTGDVYLYIDGIYIGNFTSYFPDNPPLCGQNGTITRYLYPGNHTYTVYYKSTGQMYSGNVNLKPGECKMYKVKGPITYYEPKPASEWKSSNYINKSFCSISFKLNQSKIIFTTNDKDIYNVFQKGKLVGEVTSEKNLEFNNLTSGTYQFYVYRIVGDKKKRKNLRWAKSFSLSVNDRIHKIQITDRRMGFGYSSNYNNNSGTLKSSKVRDRLEFRGDYKWTPSLGFTIYDGTIGGCVSLERRFLDWLALRADFRFDDFIGLGINVKFIYPFHEKWDYSLSLSNVYIFDYYNWSGFRTGIDWYFWSRFRLSFDIGVGNDNLFKTETIGLWSFESNLNLGVSFNLKRKK